MVLKRSAVFMIPWLGNFGSSSRLWTPVFLEYDKHLFQKEQTLLASQECSESEESEVGLMAH